MRGIKQLIINNIHETIKNTYTIMPVWTTVLLLQQVKETTHMFNENILNYFYDSYRKIVEKITSK